MNRQVLLRLYPRAWRERYGEELAAQLEAQRPLRMSVVADVVRGALDAHLHPVRRDNSTMRISNMDRRSIAARAAVAWSPVAAVGAAAVLLLIDFWEGHMVWYRLVGFPSESESVFVSGSGTWFRYDGSSWVRFFPADQLYDLALHFAMLAVALSGALMFAAVARKALRASEPSVS
jgi:hypothetical protein